MIKQTGKMVVLTELVDQQDVFEDRRHAGAILASMLASYCDSDAIVFAIPAGGVPVAAEITQRLHLPLDVAIASKMLFPWTTEAGFGAIAFDGTQWIKGDSAKLHGDVRGGYQRSVPGAYKLGCDNSANYGEYTGGRTLKSCSLNVEGSCTFNAQKAAVPVNRLTLITCCQYWN